MHAMRARARGHVRRRAKQFAARSPPLLLETVRVHAPRALIEGSIYAYLRVYVARRCRWDACTYSSAFGW